MRRFHHGFRLAKASLMFVLAGVSVFAPDMALAESNTFLPSTQMERDQKEMRLAPDRVKLQMINLAFSVSPDGAVTPEMIDEAVLRGQAQRRGRDVGLYLVYDLNSDGLLSEDELAKAEQNASQHRQKGQIRMMRIGSDTNSDGFIDLLELYAYAEKSRRRPMLGAGSRYESLLEMDTNKDGTTTIEEIVAYVDAVSTQPAVSRPTKLRTIGVPRPLPKE
ncbi:MAG: hypothetical protein ACRBBV_02575 [Paracoccaceae bacterium]